MQLGHPLRVVSGGLDGDVLLVLARADAGFSGRQIARVVGASVEGVRRALIRLLEQGIVTREPLGPSMIFRLNREHLAAAAVIALAGLRSEFYRRLEAEVDAWSIRPQFVAVFGSVARGDERPTSDLDIFVLRADGIDIDHPTWRAQVDGMADQVTRWTGNDARVLEFSQDELFVRQGYPEPVVQDIVRQGVPVFGSLDDLGRVMKVVG